VRLVLVYMEFEKVKDEFDTVVMNTTAAREHVRGRNRKVNSVYQRARTMCCC